MSVRMTFLLCLLSEAHRSEGLGIPSPHLGCHTGPGVVAGPVSGPLYLAVPVPVSCLFLLCFRTQRLWFDSGYMLRQFTEAWEFHTFSA